MAYWAGLVWLTAFYIISVAEVVPEDVSAAQYTVPVSGTIGKVLQKRQAQELSWCILPPPLMNGRYRGSKIRCSQEKKTPACQMIPGTAVPPDWVLYQDYCDDGYSWNSNNTISVCTNGRWEPRLSSCVGPGGFLGCFKDTGKRLLRAHRQDFPGKLTNKICIQHCARKGFLYAGTEYGGECYCGNVEPSRNDAQDTQECNMKCAGDPGENCGGFWRLAVFITNSENVRNVLRSLGCFKDSGKRLLAAHRQDSSSLTNRMCVEHCARKGYKYAGTENGHECFCGDAKPMNYLLENSSECNKPCPGNQEENCGGVWRLAVYATNITSNNNRYE